MNKDNLLILNSDNNLYYIKRVLVPRGIRSKSSSSADEVLITCFNVKKHKDKFHQLIYDLFDKKTARTILGLKVFRVEW